MGFRSIMESKRQETGFYKLSLNLPFEGRSSESAVRKLSLTPPGANSSAVLKHFFPDIIKGMTEGFLETDADGKKKTDCFRPGRRFGGHSGFKQCIRCARAYCRGMLPFVQVHASVSHNYRQ